MITMVFKLGVCNELVKFMEVCTSVLRLSLYFFFIKNHWFKMIFKATHYIVQEINSIINMILSNLSPESNVKSKQANFSYFLSLFAMVLFNSYPFIQILLCLYSARVWISLKKASNNQMAILDWRLVLLYPWVTYYCSYRDFIHISENECPRISLRW